MTWLAWPGHLPRPLSLLVQVQPSGPTFSLSLARHAVMDRRTL